MINVVGTGKQPDVKQDRTYNHQRRVLARKQEQSQSGSLIVTNQNASKVAVHAA
jgi:hypothetical protein